MGKSVDALYSIFLRENKVFLNFFKSKFPVVHNSNIFRSDFHYAVSGFYEVKGHSISYAETEKLLAKIANYFEENGVIIKIDGNTWKVNQPQFATGSPHIYEVNGTADKTN